MSEYDPPSAGCACARPPALYTYGCCPKWTGVWMDDNAGHAAFDPYVAGILMPYRMDLDTASQRFWGQQPVLVAGARFVNNMSIIPPVFSHTIKPYAGAFNSYFLNNTESGDWPPGPVTRVLNRVGSSITQPLASVTTKWNWYCSLKAALAARSWGAIIQFGQVGMIGGGAGVVTAACTYPTPMQLDVEILDGSRAGDHITADWVPGTLRWTWPSGTLVWNGFGVFGTTFRVLDPLFPAVPTGDFTSQSCLPFELVDGPAHLGGLPGEDCRITVRPFPAAAVPVGTRATTCCSNALPVVLWLHYAFGGDQWMQLVWDGGIWKGSDSLASFNLRCSGSSTWEAQIDGGSTWTDFGAATSCDPFQLDGAIVVTGPGLLTCTIYDRKIT